ncbi:hypothetical protein ACIBSW_06810 [Actinoplanes sp. NPDC049668]|uniref:hypothetical protein n=1 Tax=unclassified Actinoplanes TaxID=2626549 RepID=UPI0033A86EB4
MADVLINARIFGRGVNFSGQSNKVDFTVEADEADATVFEPDNPADAGWKARRATVLDFKAGFSGHWFAGDPSKVDDALWSGLGAVDVWTFVKGTGAVGDLAWSGQSLESKYSFLGDHGKLAPFDATLNGSGPLVRGRVAHPHTVVRSAAGTGDALVFAAGIPAGNHLWAALHVFSVGGTGTPALSVLVESDDNPAFTTPVQRLAFVPATAAQTGQLLRAAGPVTDMHYRVRWTVTGGTPSFLFAATLGVAPA